MLAVIDASPFHLGKSAEREQTISERVAETGFRCCGIWWVGRTKWFLKAVRLPWGQMVEWPGARLVLKKICHSALAESARRY